MSILHSSKPETLFSKESNVECVYNNAREFSTVLHENSWSRRCSTETILSIQGVETDIARDTSDTDAVESDVEYEPVSESEEDGPVDGDTSEFSDNDLIKTKVIEVSAVRETELMFADSERTDSQGSDSEMDYHDYWHCAQCRAKNNNPLYRYCQKCFTVRKNFFPPRPKRKTKRLKGPEDSSGSPQEPLSQPLSQDSGVDFIHSQELSQDPSSTSKTQNVIAIGTKRRSSSVDRINKRAKYSESSGTDNEVIPLAKTISDPAITIEESIITKKVLSKSLKEIEIDSKKLCVVCITEPKSGVFVHGQIAHICCCYKCAKKVWAKAKRCPVCNCKISNVLKAVVM